MTNHRSESRFQLNIGFIVFAIIFVYLTITIIVNMLKETVSVCRVEQGQIVSSASFTGICLRDEEVILASEDGYINFYVGEGDKISEYGKIYLMNSNPPVDSSISDSQTSKSMLDYSEMRDQITVFSKNYSDSQYGQIYSLKTSMHSLSSLLWKMQFSTVCGQRTIWEISQYLLGMRRNVCASAWKMTD